KVTITISDKIVYNFSRNFACNINIKWSLFITILTLNGHFFPLFESYVENVLQKISQSGQSLTRFRLRLGGDKASRIQRLERLHDCEGQCFPYPDPARLNAWISFPLTHLGLRELDLSFHVREPLEYQLPAGLFACRSLEVLKLDSNLQLNAEISTICLPNLKLLHLHCFYIVENDFVTRLVSSCPSLEDLAIAYCLWDQLDLLDISSRSLRKLVLIIWNDDEENNSDLTHIDTPNLQYFQYSDNLATQYCYTSMNALVQAHVSVEAPLRHTCCEDSLQTQLQLFRMLSNVEHLSLFGSCVQNMHFGGEFEDQLNVFPNLKTLELGANPCQARWDTVLLQFLTCSLNLETLAFPKGFFDDIGETGIIYATNQEEEAGDLEDQVWKTTEAIPYCFHSNLKRIVIENYFGIERELNIVRFLLKKASSLHEFVVCLSSNANDNLLLERTLKELPRTSTICSVQVQY
ncbi:F-box/LRR-repeat protein At4g14103-like, partial [Silene latifolia]|uniref:F-box/LRR-repeat protein At4g14103-like n=1 Tax=Silene latifolia TaxID=37657 RepID=UPI003D776C56